MRDQVTIPDRPEIELLLAAVRPKITPEASGRMSRLCRAGLDWEFLLREARRHSVLPLLDRGLRLHDGTRPPAPVRELLRAACRLTQRRNLALTAELLRILAALEDAGIAAVPFKGPVLAALAYGDLALRPFGDLDVLVRERDMARARAALVKRGYLPEFAFSAAGERAFRKAECALQFRHAGRDVVLELHWRLTERYLSVHLPVERLWERLAPVPLAGRMVPAFAPEDLLLYLCIHGGKHEWERLEWLCSVAWLAAACPRLDWDAIRRRARDSGTGRLLHLGLMLAQEVLGLEAPAETGAAIGRDRAARRLAAETGARLFEPERPEPARGKWYFHLLRSRERWRDRARIVCFSSVRMPHPSSREVVTLPARLSFLYYLFRPARLLSASMAAAWRHAIGRRNRDGGKERAQSICTR